MSEFKGFKLAVEAQMASMESEQLYKADVTKEEIWDMYLGSFPQGSNPIHKEKTVHDCNCCKKFIRAGGNLVTITPDLELTSIWDIDVGGDFQVVANALSELVKSRAIRNLFLTKETDLGTDYNLGLEGDGIGVIRYEHLHYKVPSKFRKAGESIGAALGKTLGDRDVLKRTMEEVSLDSMEVVLDLIAQGTLYRGAEHKVAVKLIRKLKKEYLGLLSGSNIPTKVDLYLWKTVGLLGSKVRVRNSAIGTLIVDIAEGMELDRAVGSFEQKVAPANYKRPTALVTPKMIDAAEKKVEELDIGEALPRRYAVTEDLTINNVLHADRSVRKAMNVFDELKQGAVVKKGNLGKVEEVSIDTFINDILPTASSISLLMENRHTGNLMSLIAPEDSEAASILKWNNNFTWSYQGEVTDSIKERVKAAGGAVSGDLRISLGWHNGDDLDLHIKEPNGNTIYHGSKVSRNGGAKLDVDMNAGGTSNKVNPVENTTWADKKNILAGVHEVKVNNYSQRGKTNPGFTIELEYGGVVHTFHYAPALSSGQNVVVAKFTVCAKKGLTIVESIPSSSVSKEVWGIGTETYHKVNMVMNSPNHWDDQTVGNKHLFFILDKCYNEDSSRGFYNEFLREDLTEHRKVFELLGAKMRVEPSENQLSGLGFSSTQRNSIYCKVTGAFERTIKINF